MKIKEAVSNIKQGNVKNFYLIAGSEDFLRELALKSILSNLNIQMEELNVSVIRDSSNIQSNLESLPMMSDLRAVIAYLNEFSEQDIKRMEACLPGMSPSTVLILIKPSAFDKRKSLESFVLKNGAVIDCSEPAESETVDFLCAHAAKSGLKMARNDAHMFFQYVMGDLNHMVKELDKLILVCSDTVTKKDIQKYTVKSSEYNIFQLHDLFLQKNRERAKNLLAEILDEDSNPIGLITILSTNFELMLIARACMDAGYREDMIRKNILDNAKVADFRAKKAIEQCRYMDAPSIRNAIQKIAKIDFDAKQGNVVLKNDPYALLCGIYGI
jgi:DNA polymerase-3 subunit delta